MKPAGYFSLWLAAVLLGAGAYILQQSVRNSGHYAEAGVLAGALLTGLALAAMTWSIKLRQGVKALEKHMRGR
jgi:hypothetical protein